MISRTHWVKLLSVLPVLLSSSLSACAVDDSATDQTVEESLSLAESTATQEHAELAL
jgi:hypothetical protein